MTEPIETARLEYCLEGSPRTYLILILNLRHDKTDAGAVFNSLH